MMGRPIGQATPTVEELEQRIEELEEQLEAVSQLPKKWVENTKHMKFKGHQQAIQEACNCSADLRAILQSRLALCEKKLVEQGYDLPYESN